MLTDTQIRNAKPKDKPYKLPKESGLCLVVNPNGAKYWRFMYSFGARKRPSALAPTPSSR